MSDCNTKERKNGTPMLSRISVILSVTAGLVLLGYLIILCVMENIRVVESRTDDDFTRVRDYTCREVECEDAPVGIVKEYTFTVSEVLQNDTHLAFYVVHQYVDVYLDEEKVYSLRPVVDHWIGRTVGSNWVMIPLYREDAGKEIRVEIIPVYRNFINREVEFYIGSQLNIYTDRLVKDLPQLVLSAMAVFVGFIFLCIAFIRRFKKQKNGINFDHGTAGDNLACLGLFSVMIGLWRLTDTRFTPFMFPEKPLLLFYVSMTMMMLGIIPLIRSIRGRNGKKGNRIFDIFCIVTALICLLQILLQMCDIMDLRENLIVTHFLLVAGAIVIICNNISDRIRHPEEYRKRVGRNLPLICVAGVVADIIVYYVRGTSSGLLFSLLGFLLYIVFMGISMMFLYGEQKTQLAEKNRLLAENERQLTESRIATMISQIQPHFIYNTLGTIGQFCLEDPEKAADLVQEFSLYLRGNFTELDNSMPIRISQEIEHVRHYVGIEQIRFPDMQVEYNLQAGEFLIPALTIQPLVENAIKHGLMGLEEGGKVVISTYETKEAYVVCVKDDGVGFDQSALSDGKPHVGIKNIRGRLEAMCGGTLTIDSTPGAGTTAQIMIPKEEER
ncbi:MAG: sensor histidine kinase [Lachnospiraceae bacterium]